MTGINPGIPCDNRAGRHVEIVIPDEVVKIATDGLGAFFERLNGIDRRTLVSDFLAVTKAWHRADVLQRYAPLQGAKLLEVGSGFGTNLAAWIAAFKIDGTGIEPGGVGFDSSFRASQLLLSANDIDPSRVQNGVGEALPFEDESFDIVYSTNVLEHTNDPRQVLFESVRVLRSGGLLHMEMPNFRSFFEGHYMIVQPPIWSSGVLAAWVRLRGRDPAFARTLRTEINPRWCRSVCHELQKRYRLTPVSLGEEVFLERLGQPLEFETTVVAGKLGGVASLLRSVNVGNWIGRTVVGFGAQFPIYLTVRKH